MSALGDRLVGAWHLVSYTWEGADGRRVFPLGELPTGLIVYTVEGQVSVNMMRSGRPAWAAGTLDAGTADEMSEAVRGYIAYAGSYTVDEKARRVDHHVTTALFPNWVGLTQSRSVDLDGPQLTLSAVGVPTATGVVTARIGWRRAGRAGAP